MAPTWRGHVGQGIPAEPTAAGSCKVASLQFSFCIQVWGAPAAADNSPIFVLAKKGQNIAHVQCLSDGCVSETTCLHGVHDVLADGKMTPPEILNCFCDVHFQC